MFDLENIDQGHGAQQSQWFHSMANSVIFMIAHDYVATPIDYGL